MLKGKKTYLYAAAVALIGTLEQLDVTQFVTAGNEGIALAVVALGVAILRRVTSAF